MILSWMWRDPLEVQGAGTADHADHLVALSSSSSARYEPSWPVMPVMSAVRVTAVPYHRPPSLSPFAPASSGALPTSCGRDWGQLHFIWHIMSFGAQLHAGLGGDGAGAGVGGAAAGAGRGGAGGSADGRSGALPGRGVGGVPGAGA